MAARRVLSTRARHRLAPRTGSGPGQWVGNVKDLPVNAALPYTDPASGDPAVVVHLPTGAFVSFDALCTHGGCTVQYDPGQRVLVCPCHSGTFDPARNGAVVGGPPPAPLPALAIRVDGAGNAFALDGDPLPGQPGETPPPPVTRPFTLTVNGRSRRVTVDPRMPLLYVLRGVLGLKGLRFGCGLAQCGACTVLLDGTPVRSCVTRVAAASGRRVVTLEGLGTPENPHPLQRAFIAEQAAQCGYCSSGMIVAAAALLGRTPTPTNEQIKQALAGNLCRCGSHLRVLRAVKRAAKEMS